MKFIFKLLPPKEWRFPVLMMAGIFAGLFFFLIYISKAHSYLSDEPETCVNCHIMAPQYATWSHGSHGMRHASMFALRLEPQVIFIHEAGQEVVHQNCIRCHSKLLLNPKLVSSVENQKVHATDRLCWECHREVPHGRVNSLSSTPNARVPLPESPVPAWLKEYLSE